MTKCNIKEDWLPAGQCEMLCGPDHHWNWWKLITKKPHPFTASANEHTNGEISTQENL